MTADVVEIEDLPIAHVPGNSLRARLRVLGDIRARTAEASSRRAMSFFNAFPEP